MLRNSLAATGLWSRAKPPARTEGKGILKIAKEVGCGVSVVQRVVKEAEEAA